VRTATINDTPPFRREQYAGSEFEDRDQVGGVLVGTLDLNTDTIVKRFVSTGNRSDGHRPR
jgi:hypothetical protein